MKLSFELKLEIYEKHLAGYGFNYLADEYHLADTTVRHFCNLADKHGTDILRRSKKTIRCRVFPDLITTIGRTEPIRMLRIRFLWMP